jgi:hypothetical protein
VLGADGSLSIEPIEQVSKVVGVIESKVSGSVAANGLADYIVITCSPRATDRYRRVVAVCLAGGFDLAHWASPPRA